ncbi:hypothetical protein GCM10007103_18400 [Salinimicrobium marinum]|uniref:Thioredoxin domain-containing protein n=1 Tax=Salinimicrobium marinum TaxID=680283 RepID=A0A918VZE1_9FLAO|nr:hypothetical protein [Salinimicrobium marinum]GHA37356.1 hypothetical protein GCM10007103_18400 [Salinimicrobium marinum]
MLLLLTVILTATGCNENKEKEKDAFVGGQVVNPTSNNVIILKDNVPLDTIPLDKRKRFSYTVKNAETGLYVFKHNPHSQTFFLQPGDSLLIRANSIDFDESLHFSGTGSEKNNLLIQTFLETENNIDLVLSYYKITPEEFKTKTDSIKCQQLDLLKHSDRKNKFSKEFLEFAEKSILYDSYDLKERYTYMVNKYYKKFSRQMPADFHGYRKEVNFNDGMLQTCTNYIRFIENYLINMAMAECAVANKDHNDCYDLYDHGNITSRINIIDTLTNLPLVKEHFYSKFGALGIIMAKERQEIVNILDLLKEKSYPEEMLEKMVQTGNLQLAYLPGMNVTDITILNTSGEEKKYSQITSKPSIIFLWSIYSPQNHKKNHRKMAELRKRYPEIDFIGVNIDTGEYDKWISTIGESGYEKKYEFQLNYNLEKDIFQNYLNKSLFIDKNNVVVTGDAFIHSPDFESRIVEFLNQ